MTRAFIIISITLFIFGICLSQELPNTAAGNRAQEIIDLINQQSSFSLEDYINNHFAPEFRDAFPMSVHTGIFRMTQDMFGTVLVDNITSSTPDDISLILKSSEKNAWLNLELQVESQAPHRIRSLGFQPARAPAPARDTAAFSDIDELDHYLSELSADNQFSGAVLIARNGRAIFHNAYGFASKESKTINQPDTRFNIGSLSKLFTGVAIAQLAEKGKLSLDEPIGNYLKMFPQDIAEKVTIRQLLTMRSGWGDYWSNDYYLTHRDELQTVSDYLEFIKAMPLDFEPGTNVEHSNTGYIVAGAIIEAVSGLDYYDYIRKYVYDPAGMSQSGAFYRDEPTENSATGYTNYASDDKSYRKTNREYLPLRGTPAGGTYSTVGDLLKFASALCNHQLANKKYTRLVLDQFAEAGDKSSALPDKMARFAGGAPGISAFLGIDFRSAYTIIVLSNYDMPVAIDVAKGIIQMLKIDG